MTSYKKCYTYFDGGIVSMGNLFWSRKTFDKINIMVNENCYKEYESFLHAFTDPSTDLEKKMSTRVFIQNKYKYVPNITTNTSHMPSQAENPIEYFFEYISTKNEELQEYILENTIVCNKFGNNPCLECELCNKYEEYSNKYGIYDCISCTNTRSLDFLTLPF
tara:strand:- start:874 stop:1362 length:489 start_codon:yes stop_codon:yes gene_type:complete